MVIIVDFNSVEEDGRIPTLLDPDQGPSAARGQHVVAADGEGTECDAVIDEVAADGSYAMLRPLEGTTRPSNVEPSATDPLAR